jgi:hypothetical protein
MKKRELGFHHGAPENLDRTWEKEINGTTYLFKKAREKRFFLYNCQRRSADGYVSGSSGFYSDRDLTPEEIEQLPQFDQFIGRGPAIRTASSRKGG